MDTDWDFDDTDDDIALNGDDAQGRLLLFFVIMNEGLRSRGDRVFRQRLQWGKRVEKLEFEGKFERTYRMSVSSFNKLLFLLGDGICVDQSRSVVSSGVEPFAREIVLHCLLRWLAGGSYLDIRDIAEISVASFYRVLHVAMKAVLSCNALKMHFPETKSELTKAAANFTVCSSYGVINGCVGCVDGMLVRIRTPASTETGNVVSYFSGHYQAVGVNVQAVCDHLSRFTFMSVAAPGGANDVRAFSKTSAAKLVEKLPIGKYLIGDNAYIPSEHMITPFSGSHRDNPHNDAYNFYVSQLRIKIEQAFGLMTTKWRILRRPLQVKLVNVGRVIMTIGRLHNFGICERPDAVATDSVDPLSTGRALDLEYLPSDTVVIQSPGVSVIRDRIVRHIKERALARPHYNISRNKRKRSN